MKEFLESALEGEMTYHMSTCLEDSENQNPRNGKGRKKVQSLMGAFELETPRDREGSFEPQIVKKRQTVLNEFLDNKILGLYGLRMSYQDITSHLKEIYNFDVSAGMLNAVTEKLLSLIAEWRASFRSSLSHWTGCISNVVIMGVSLPKNVPLET